jgi:chromosome segregation ATPase
MAMKFKSVEDAVTWIKDNLNLIKLEGSEEFSIKETVDAENALSKKVTDFDKEITEKKKLKERAHTAETKLKEAEAALESVNTELAGLKDIKGGGAEETLQKLNKEKADLVTKINALEVEKRDLQKQVEELPTLKTQIENFKEQNNRSKILETLRKTAAEKKVPQHIIDQDFERLVVPDFTIDENGQIWTKDPTPKSVENYIAEKQKERPHWQPPSQGANAQPGKTNTTAPVNIAGLFST